MDMHGDQGHVDWVLLPRPSAITMATREIDSRPRFQWRWDESTTNAPALMERGTSAVHDGVAYFSPGGSQDVFACDPNNEYVWSLLAPCPQRRYGLVVINHRLTAVGGESPSGQATNRIFSYNDSSRWEERWEECYPPMPTKRVYPAVVCFCESLIAAGGGASWGGNCLDVVEVMDTETGRWDTACSLPEPVSDMMAIALGKDLFFVGGYRGRGSAFHVCQTVLKCDTDVLSDESCIQNALSHKKVWKTVADVPVYNTSCVKMFGQLLAVGGSTDFGVGLYKPTNAIYMYDPHSDSWPIVGHMPTARHSSLVVAIKNSIVVVGGRLLARFIHPRRCKIVEVGFLLLSDEDKHIAAFEEAVKEKGKLDQTIMHCVFVGPPRSGKSSLIKRLTGERPSPSLPSTGVAEKVIQVQIRKPMASSVKASGLDWNKLSFNDEATSLMVEITRNQASDLSLPLERSTRVEPGFEPYASPTDIGSTHLLPAVSPVIAGVPDFKRLFKYALRKKGWLKIKEHIQGASTVYLTDTGGQLEFQELFPALISGPSIFFLVFGLDRDLNERITMKYVHPVTGASAERYQTTFTTKEYLLQSLASIASIGTRADKDQQCRSLMPRAFIVGTHRDKVSETDIQGVDSQLKKLIQSTAHFNQDIVQYASKDRDRLILAVNNLADGDSDVLLVRAAIERMSKHDDFKVSTPTSWLIFSLAIRQVENRILSYDECFLVAKNCGINSTDELDKALWFLHSKMGLIRHYQGEGFVIQDTQVLFDNITGLIGETSTTVQEEFKKKGIFRFRDFETISSRGSDQLLSATELVSLLKHLRIIAPIGKEGQEEMYFMPCVLAAESSSVLAAESSSVLAAESSSVLSSETPQVPSAASIPPLLVCFRCGYCPRGLFPALVVHLLSEENAKEHLKWELETGDLFRDQISFSLQPYCDTVRLKLLPTFCEISCDQNMEISDSERSTSHATLCNEVRQCIEKGIERVTSDLHYTRRAEQRLAFYCRESHQGAQEPHPAKIIFHKQQPQNLRCVLTQTVSGVPTGSSVWFCEPVPARTEAYTDLYGERAGSSDEPTMLELLKFTRADKTKINISEEVGIKYVQFGIFLLEDGNGSRVKNMTHKLANDPERINMEILQEWLTGRGKQPVTWATLVEVLGDIELCTLADEISTVKCPK